MNALNELPDDLRLALKRERGLINAAGLRQVGISQDRVERLVRRGGLTVLARGVYSDATSIAALDEWSKFELRSRAFVLASPGGTAASDWSAVAIHRLPAVLPPPAVPSVIRRGSGLSGSNRTCHGRTRFAAIADEWLTEVDGVAVLRPAVAVVDLLRRCDALAGLTLADAVAARDESNGPLLDAWHAMRRWPSINRARWAIDKCDPDAQSALESAGRLAILRGGLPVPMSNVWIGEGRPRFRLDHYWEKERLAAEGDGLAKYHIDADPEEALRLEKEREWWLHTKGIRTIRYGWKVAVRTPDELAHRCRVLLAEPPLPKGGDFQLWPSRVGAAMLGLSR